MDYLDFEIEIGRGEGREFPVEVVRSPAGERKGSMHFPFTELELENSLLKLHNALLSGQSATTRRVVTALEAPMQAFGGQLFKALLADDVRTCFELSRREAQFQGKGLRLKLRVTDPRLAVLPWEFLFDDDQSEFVALSSNTPMVRSIELPRVVQPLRIVPPIKVLGMVASPEDLPPLNVEREKRRVEHAIAPLVARGAVEVTWLETGTWRELLRAMRKGPWHVFHFVGHGRYDTELDEGTLALVAETGETDEFTATQVGRLLADHSSLRLVLLNACEGAKGGAQDVFSGTAATLIRRGIPAVVAMQYEITDRAAIAFAQTFYESVSDGLPLDASVVEARKAISFSATSTVEWGTPVLYMQSADGVLFVLDQSAPAKQAAPKVPPDATPEAMALPAQASASEPAGKPEAGPASKPETAVPMPAASQTLGPSIYIDRPVSRPAGAPQTQPGWAAKTPSVRVPDTVTSPAPAESPGPTPPAPGEGYIFQGADGQLFVDATAVTISRHGPGGVIYRAGERVIPIEEVTDVHFAAAQPRGKGFIQICYQGGTQLKTGYWQAGSHPDTIQFTELQQEWFKSATQWIEYYSAMARRNALVALS